MHYIRNYHWVLWFCLLQFRTLDADNHFYHTIICIYPIYIFAVPLQILLRKKVKKFSVQYLLIYIVVALIALFLFSLASDPSYVLSEVKHVSFYYLSFVAAAVYWFWDSVFIKNQIK